MDTTSHKGVIDYDLMVWKGNEKMANRNRKIKFEVVSYINYKNYETGISRAVYIDSYGRIYMEDLLGARALINYDQPDAVQALSMLNLAIHNEIASTVEAWTYPSNHFRITATSEVGEIKAVIIARDIWTLTEMMCMIPDVINYKKLERPIGGIAIISSDGSVIFNGTILSNNGLYEFRIRDNEKMTYLHPREACRMMYILASKFSYKRYNGKRY